MLHHFSILLLRHIHTCKYYQNFTKSIQLQISIRYCNQVAEIKINSKKGQKSSFFGWILKLSQVQLPGRSRDRRITYSQGLLLKCFLTFLVPTFWANFWSKNHNFIWNSQMLDQQETNNCTDHKLWITNNEDSPLLTLGADFFYCQSFHSVSAKTYHIVLFSIKKLQMLWIWMNIFSE